MRDCMHCIHADVCIAYRKMEEIFLEEDCFKDKYYITKPKNEVFEAVANTCEMFKENKKN